MTLGSRGRVLVVGSRLSGLRIGGARVVTTTKGRVYDTAFWTRNASVVVVNVDQQGLAVVRDLHVLYPQLDLVAVTARSGSAADAKRVGATTVVLGRPTDSTNAVVSGVVSALLERRR